MKRWNRVFVVPVVILVTIFLGNTLLFAQAGTGRPSKEEVMQKTQKLRMPFIANGGQTDERVAFYANVMNDAGYKIHEETNAIHDTRCKKQDDHESCITDDKSKIQYPKYIERLARAANPRIRSEDHTQQKGLDGLNRFNGLNGLASLKLSAPGNGTQAQVSPYSKVSDIRGIQIDPLVFSTKPDRHNTKSGIRNRAVGSWESVDAGMQIQNQNSKISIPQSRVRIPHFTDRVMTREGQNINNKGEEKISSLAATSSIDQWKIETVDAPDKYIEGFSQRAIVLDGNGNPHCVYGGNHLYYTRYEGGNWIYETVDSSGAQDASLALDSNGKAHICYASSDSKLNYATNATGTWTITTINNSWGYNPSIALDSTGKTHISYYSGDLLYATNATGTWTTTTIDNSSGYYSSIAVDSSNNVHISYTGNSFNSIKYATNTTGTWTMGVMEGSDSSIDSYSGTSLALDASNKAHVSYIFTDTSTQCIKYASNTTGTWTTSVIVNHGGAYSSIAVDSSNFVHVSASGWDALYATNATGTWTTTTVGSGASGLVNVTRAWETSLALDSSGKVHIGYLDFVNDDLKYSTNATGSWVTETVDNGGYMGWYGHSIAHDAAGSISIAYHDSTNHDLKYAKNTTGTWTVETVDSSGDVGWYTSLALDSMSKTHISYFDGANYDLKYATNASGAWTTTTIDSKGDVGYYTSIALDSLGTAHISYLDGYNKDLKYATNASGTWTTITVDGNVGYMSWNSRTSIAIDSIGKIHISYFDGTNYNLKYATNASGAWTTTTVDVGSFPSLALDSSGNAYISYQDSTNSNLKYATNTTGTWTAEIVDSNYWLTPTSIAIDTSDNIHISYGYKYATKNMGTWTTTTVDYGYAGFYSSITSDPHGRVHISYSSFNNGTLRHATNSGESNLFPPTVTTGTATNVGLSTATLNGTVNANDTLTNAWFDYGTISGYYTGLSTTQSASGTSDSAVHIDISGLSAGTRYYYRIAAQNNAGISHGAEYSFTPGYSISGTIYQADGVTPITDADISISVYQGDPCGYNTHVAWDYTSNGVYTVYGLPSGTYYVRTWNNQSNYLDEWWAGAGSVPLSDCSAAEPITITNASVSGKDFQLDTGYSISGTIYQSDGVTPITDAGIEISVYQGDPCGDYTYVAAGYTSNGVYTVYGLPSGTYYVCTSTWNYQSNYLDEWWAGAGSVLLSDCSAAESIMISNASVSGKDFQLDTGYSISGTIYQSDGVTPITDAGIEIEVYQGDPCGSNTYVTSGYTSNGVYTVYGLPSGTYCVHTWNYQSNYLDEWWAGTGSVPLSDCSAAESIMISNASVSGKDFQLDPGDHTPPVISNVQVVAVETNATVSWNTDEAATSRVDYGITTAYGSFAEDANMVTTHTIMLNSLTPGTQYHYQVTSVDGSGNGASFAGLTFTTQPLVVPTPDGWQLYSTVGTGGNANKPNTFMAISPQTGEQIQLGGQGMTPEQYDLDANPGSGFLFGVNSWTKPGIITSIDHITGAYTEIGPILQNGSVAMLIALAFSPNGTLYGISLQNELGVINLDSVTFSTIATLDIPGRVVGMDFSPQGSLYVVDWYYNTATGQTQQWLRVVDTSTGSIIGTHAIEGDYAVGDIDFAPDGYIYHTNYSWALIKIDPSSGTQKNIGFGNLGPLGGIASFGSLQAHYTLDEGSGTIAGDSSGNGNNGAINGATWTTGIRGSGLSFDGIDDYADLGNPPGLQPEHVSLSVWFKTDTAGGKIIRKRLYGYCLEVLPSGKIAFWICNATATKFTATSPNAYNDNAWHHAVGVYDGAGVKLYIDGNLADTASAGAIHYGDGGIAIGRDGDYSGAYFNGLIDEIRVYSRALNDQEIQDIYNVGTVASTAKSTVTSLDSLDNSKETDNINANARPATGITLTPFNAKAGYGGSVNLNWKTAGGADTAGFNLYRSRHKHGRHTKVNNLPINARGDDQMARSR